MRYDDDTLRTMQLLELDILRAVDRVCREHGIEYFLDSGSALGAARHGGFIPWDDDIDIGMLRTDYDRFLAVAPQALGETYEVSEPLSNDRHSAMFAKVWLKGTKFYTVETLDAGIRQGVGIDVLPYDELSADQDVAAKQRKSCRLLQMMLYLYHSRNVVVPHKGVAGALERSACAVAHALMHAFSSHASLVGRFQKAALAGAARPGDEVMCMSYVAVGSFPKAALVPVSRCTFEGEQFPVPADLERYLETMFGDWRELPPVEQRRQHAPIELDLGTGRQHAASST